MVFGKIEKTSGLLISISAVVASLIFVPDWTFVGVWSGCGIVQRLCYSLFHASLLHAVLNAWCFLSVVFLYKIKMWQLIIAYTIAVSVPDFVLLTIPTVGLSAVCFALFGIIAFQVKRKIYYNVYMAAYITIGLIFPQVNGWLHLYSYVAGLLVGFLTMPIPCRKR